MKKLSIGIKVFVIVSCFLALAVYLLKYATYYPSPRDLEHKPDFFGVTFSTKFSKELDLDWREVYSAVLDDLGVKYIRIPVYWDEIEHEEDSYEFADYDYLINEGEARGVKFIITVGRRQPRWPECHSPAWLNKKNDSEVKSATLDMVREVVSRYRNRESVEYWQVENEPYFGAFGVCPPLDEGLLMDEIAVVRSLDDRPIIITGSGEMSSWRREGALGDIFGTTLYRVVYNSWFGYTKYPFSIGWYKLKAKLAGISEDRLMLLELQAEPWVPEGKMIYLTGRQIDRSMSVEQFRANMQYAINLDWRRAYAWGVEWWYWQKKFGSPEYWEIAKDLYN